MVIGSDGQNLGKMNTRKALNLAKDEGLDLYLASASATPQVCKIVNYGKMKYEESRKAKENKKPNSELKEVKISPRIASHDLGTMTKRAKEFLSKGHKVKLTCVFKNRELSHPEFGREKLEIMAQDLSEVGVVDKGISLENTLMTMFWSPTPKN